jgi:hypothetical protein
MHAVQDEIQPRRALSLMNQLTPQEHATDPVQTQQRGVLVPHPETSAHDPSQRKVETAAVAFLGWFLGLGLVSGTRILLEFAREGTGDILGWANAVLSFLYVVGAHGLAGFVLGTLIRLLARFTLPGGRIEPAVASPAAILEAGGEAVLSAASLELAKDRALADLRQSIRDRRWEEAGSRFDAFSRDHVNDPRLASLNEELQAARASALRDHSAQLDAARAVNDPERVLEVYKLMVPLLNAEARASLEPDLARWFLKLIHNRLRVGKIQPELVLLAGRIADDFSHTVEGASLRASLATLRRSVGLCPRCAQPYAGLGDACPACLGLGPAGPPAGAVTPPRD